MAPEYALEGRFSEKSDVFSFGVVMLEIATGTRNISFHEEGSLSLLGHVSQTCFFVRQFSCFFVSACDEQWFSYMMLKLQVWKLWNQGSIASLVDTRLSGDEGQREEVTRCIHIGLLCVQELPVDRPSVSGVLSMLSSEIVTLPVPKQPAFVINSSFSDTGTSSSHQSQDPNSSRNNVSLTMVDGR